MNSKNKFLATVVLFSGVLLLVGAGCAQKSTIPTPKNEGTPAVAPAKEEAAKPGDVGSMTDDIYVNIAAEMNYALGKGDLKYSGDEGFAKLLKDNGVTKENFDAFSTALEKDNARSASLGLKIMERLKEISK
ncbi:MAG: hypothetical protein WCV83_01720 [Candidatus Magasanikbacteria bacterium]|jgi:hypothetical protein